MESDGVTHRWNRTAVPTVAVLFLLAQAGHFLVFQNPRLAWSFVVAWFVVVCLVQFWGSRSDRVVSLVALVVMVGVIFLPLMLGASEGSAGGVVTNSGSEVTRQP